MLSTSSGTGRNRQSPSHFTYIARVTTHRDVVKMRPPHNNTDHIHRDHCSTLQLDHTAPWMSASEIHPRRTTVNTTPDSPRQRPPPSPFQYHLNIDVHTSQYQSKADSPQHTYLAVLMACRRRPVAPGSGPVCGPCGAVRCCADTRLLVQPCPRPHAADVTAEAALRCLPRADRC